MKKRILPLGVLFISKVVELTFLRDGFVVLVLDILYVSETSRKNQLRQHRVTAEPTEQCPLSVLLR